ncbi:serine protease SP24D [Stomoxys calcitrans]|uniref:Peptidase S1 domain-containing protein n=1 Tax=Stomoxys calcitrans TaxID=35570 RepID=A0A1I8NXI4_STOCA|nr:serine protease SP24D [Stomoxys calcitrans]
MTFEKPSSKPLLFFYLCLAYCYGVQAANLKLQGRIVGGQNAILGQFPYQVSVQVVDMHVCGGAIISNDYVVTAAHCVYHGDPLQLIPNFLVDVRAGSILHDADGQRVGVAEIKPHPEFHGHTNDIALLKLSRPLEFNENVRAIGLATEEPRSGSQLSITGWGRLSENGIVPGILQHTTLFALAHEQCQTLAAIPPHVMCVLHNDGEGACDGDSGSPAVLNNQLVGVAIFVKGKCGTLGPDGYASVPHYRQWLIDNSRD